jgi:hypothetical protein
MTCNVALLMQCVVLLMGGYPKATAEFLDGGNFFTSLDLENREQNLSFRRFRF